MSGRIYGDERDVELLDVQRTLTANLEREVPLRHERLVEAQAKDISARREYAAALADMERAARRFARAGSQMRTAQRELDAFRRDYELLADQLEGARHALARIEAIARGEQV